MKLKNLYIPTNTMRKGMKLKDFFEEVAFRTAPGLPYQDEQGNFIGRISIRDVFKRLVVPDHLLRMADAIGDQTDNLDLPDMEVMKLMDLPVEDFILENIPSVSPRSSLVKALAVMELHNSSYIFLFDGDTYLGVLTRMTLTKRMLQCYLDKKGEA